MAVRLPDTRVWHGARDNLSPTTIALSAQTARARGRQLEIQEQLRWLDEQQEKIIAGSANKSDPAERAEDIKSHRALIRNVGEKAGLTLYQMVQRDKAFRNAYAAALANARTEAGDVDQVIAELEAALLRAAQDKSSSVGFGTRFGTFMPGRVKGMVIHHTGGRGTVDDVIETFKKRNFPAHFVIDRDGYIYQILPDGARGQHVKNSWGPLGSGFGNSNLEGIEIIAQNDNDVTPAQRDAAIALVHRRALRWGYDPKDGVFGHGELNPGHKERDEGMTVVSAIRGGAIDSPKQTPDAAALGDQGAISVFDAMQGPELRSLLNDFREVRDNQQRELAAAASVERKEEYERRMRDAPIGKGALPGREEIEADPILSTAHRAALRSQWAPAVRDTHSFNAARDRFSNNKPFDPNDNEDRKNADRIYRSMNGDDTALTAIIERTGIFPESAAAKMRGDMLSGDVERVLAAMNRVEKALAINPNVMNGVEGGAELERSLVKLRSLRGLGMSEEQAARRLAGERALELQDEP